MRGFKVHQSGSNIEPRVARCSMIGANSASGIILAVGSQGPEMSTFALSPDCQCCQLSAPCLQRLAVGEEVPRRVPIN